MAKEMELGADALILAGNKFYKRILPEKTLDCINDEGGLVNMPLNLILPSGLEIPIFDILVPLALNEPAKN